MKLKWIASALVFAGLVACNSSQTEQKETEEEAMIEQKAYACPMECEEGKTYAEAGKCPVCKMDLEEVLADAQVEPEAHPEH